MIQMKNVLFVILILFLFFQFLFYFNYFTSISSSSSLISQDSSSSSSSSEDPFFTLTPRGMRNCYSYSPSSSHSHSHSHLSSSSSSQDSSSIGFLFLNSKLFFNKTKLSLLQSNLIYSLKRYQKNNNNNNNNNNNKNNKNNPHNNLFLRIIQLKDDKIHKRNKIRKEEDKVINDIIKLKEFIIMKKINQNKVLVVFNSIEGILQTSISQLEEKFYELNKNLLVSLHFSSIYLIGYASDILDYFNYILKSKYIKYLFTLKEISYTLKEKAEEEYLNYFQQNPRAAIDNDCFLFSFTPSSKHCWGTLSLSSSSSSSLDHSFHSLVSKSKPKSITKSRSLADFILFPNLIDQLNGENRGSNSIIKEYNDVLHSPKIYQSNLIENNRNFNKENYNYEYFLSHRNEFRLVATLTTLPDRLPNLYPVLLSLLHQHVKPDRVYLNIPKNYRRFNKTISHIHIPNEIQQLSLNDVLTIQLVPNDYGPATKLIPTLEIENDENTLILTVDDDMIYKPTQVQILLKAYFNYPYAAYGHAGQLLDMEIDKYDYYGNFQSRFRKKKQKFLSVCTAWEWKDSDYAVDILEAFRCALYRRNFFPNLTLIKDIPKECIFTDDIWFSSLLSRQGIPRIKLAQGWGDVAEFTISDNVTPLRDDNLNGTKRNILCSQLLWKDFENGWITQKGLEEYGELIEDCKYKFRNL